MGEGQGPTCTSRNQDASWKDDQGHRGTGALQAQRMPVAMQLAAADEIATELRLAPASEDATVA